MINYVEVRKKDTKAFALIEPSECWFELSYYEVGEFELYCKATKNNLNALQLGNFVSIPNKPFIWYITSIEYTFNASQGRMIIAKGKEAKYLLNKRIIDTPYTLNKIDVCDSIATLVDKILNERDRDLGNFIVDECIGDVDAENDIQAVRGNLYDFASETLRTYKKGLFTTLYDDNIHLFILQNSDKSDRVIFSQSLDNLLSCSMYRSDENVRTYALDVATKQDETTKIDKDYLMTYDLGKKGLDRSELLVESKVDTKYTDASGNEQETTPDSALFKGWQLEEAKKELSNHTLKTEISGEIDIANSRYKFGLNNDLFLGDLIKIKDEYFNFETKARVTKITYKQTTTSYGEELEYGEE